MAARAVDYTQQAFSLSVMRIPVSWMVLIASLAVPIMAQSDDAPILKLPTFTVVAELFGLTYGLNSEGLVERATVTQVTKNNAIYKIGLREGAQLISINGTKVVGLNNARFQELIREPGVGETKTVVFAQGKWVRKTITANVTGKPPKPRKTDAPPYEGSGEKGLPPDAR